MNSYSFPVKCPTCDKISFLKVACETIAGVQYVRTECWLERRCDHFIVLNSEKDYRITRGVDE